MPSSGQSLKCIGTAAASERQDSGSQIHHHRQLREAICRGLAGAAYRSPPGQIPTSTSDMSRLYCAHSRCTCARWQRQTFRQAVLGSHHSSSHLSLNKAAGASLSGCNCRRDCSQLEGIGEILQMVPGLAFWLLSGMALLVLSLAG